MVIPVCRGMRDEIEKFLDSFLHMKCNTDNCKEVLSLREEAKPSSLTVSTALGLTLQDGCKYSAHQRTKLWEAKMQMLV